MSLMAQSGHSLRRKFCPLSDNSGQRWILARDGLFAFGPKADMQGTSRLPLSTPFQSSSGECRIKNVNFMFGAVPKLSFLA